MAKTVEWLAKLLYEAAIKAEAEIKGVPAHPLDWDSTNEGTREIHRRALTAALEALGDPALLKLREGEPIFTLRAQDQVAPSTIADWRLRALRAGMYSTKKLSAVDQKMQDFLSWQAAHPEWVKVPD